VKKSRRIILVCTSAIGLLLFGWIAYEVAKPVRPLLFMLSPREIRHQDIRLRFRQVTGIQLPETIQIDKARAIVNQNYPQAIFVRFETDARGIEYALTMFGTGNTKILDANELAELQNANVNLFPVASRWQDEIRVRLYDQRSLVTAHVVEYPSSKVVVDDLRSVVYAFADRRPSTHNAKTFDPHVEKLPIR
jgi:hypothetical protein